nr:MAG TPA: hypothetical protein [Caudoviricetes sp.]
MSTMPSRRPRRTTRLRNDNKKPLTPCLRRQFWRETRPLGQR